jgi:hypothetical protein
MSSQKTLFLWRPARFWHDLKAESNEWVRVKVSRIGLPPLLRAEDCPAHPPDAAGVNSWPGALSIWGERGRRTPCKSMYRTPGARVHV